MVYLNIRFESLEATVLSDIFSGTQPLENVNIFQRFRDRFRVFVIIITLKIGTGIVPDTSEHLYFLQRLSAGEDFIVSLC
jgi:adenosyl cobinamide kinase/adenosyl cobinamide phosphate guanylyltransferase